MRAGVRARVCAEAIGAAARKRQGTTIDRIPHHQTFFCLILNLRTIYYYLLYFIPFTLMGNV